LLQDLARQEVEKELTGKYSQRVLKEGTAARWRVGGIPEEPFVLRSACQRGFAPHIPVLCREVPFILNICARGVPFF